jgi:hypothetical protein
MQRSSYITSWRASASLKNLPDDLRTVDHSSRLRVRFNRVRFHAKARSREVKTSVNFGLAILESTWDVVSIELPELKGIIAETQKDMI